MFLEEWGLVLRLPVRGRESPIQPSVDEYFGVDWGAFGTVDFERYRGRFNPARYRAERLREELRDALRRGGIEHVYDARLRQLRRQDEARRLIKLREHE